MKRRVCSVTGGWSAWAAGWLVPALLCSAQDATNYEPLRPLPAQRSIYLRVPHGTDARALTSTAFVGQPAAGAPTPTVPLPPVALPPVAPPAVNAATAPVEARPSELWMVSTRRLPSVEAGLAAPPFAPDVYRYVAGRGWTPATIGQLLSRAPAGTVTDIFVHGNDTSAEMAATGGEHLYGQLIGNAPPHAPATRFVVWSWPNDPTTVRVRKTAQANALRSGIEGFYLATFVGAAAEQNPVHLVGYSSGAGVVTAGLHMLGGGALDSRRLAAGPRAARKSVQAVLLGAATPNTWILPGMPHERAVSQVDRLVITVNAEDAVLKWFPMLWEADGPEALGATGIRNLARLGKDQDKIVQVNVEDSLYTRHGWKYYSSSPQVLELLRQEIVPSPLAVTRLPAGGPVIAR